MDDPTDPTGEMTQHHPDLPTDPQLAQVSDDIAVDPSLENPDVQDEDDDEPVAKRQRLVEENQDPSLEDEAMLSALAAHSQTGNDDHQYGQEYVLSFPHQSSI